MSKKTVLTILTAAIAFPALPTTGAYASETVSSSVANSYVEEPSMPMDRSISSDADGEAKSQAELQAEATVTKDEAVQAAKAFKAIPSSYTLQSVSLHSMGDTPVWNIDWEWQGGEDEEKWGNISVEVDATSKNILTYRHSIPLDEQISQYPPDVEKAEAEKIAQSYLDKEFPSISKELGDVLESEDQRPPLNGRVSYSFTFPQVINGVPFPENHVQVEVRGDGNIESLRIRQRDVQNVQSPGEVLDKEAALAAFQQDVPLQLYYKTFHRGSRSGSDEVTVLAYELAYQSAMFDAKTGDWIRLDGEVIEKENEPVAPLAEEAIAPAPEAKKELSQEQAIKLFKEKAKVSEGFTLENISYDQYDDQASWRMSLTNEKQTISGAIDAKSHRIVDYSFWSHNSEDEQKEPALKKDEAREKAIEAVKNFAPHLLHQLTEHPNRYTIYYNEDEYSFEFARLSDGVIVENQSVNVNIDSHTGELSNYHENWDAGFEGPPKAEAQSAEEVREDIVAPFDINLMYTTIGGEESDEERLQLVYALSGYQDQYETYFDAVKGRYLSIETGSPIIPVENVTDIEGHWAEEALRLLVSYGALNVSEEGLVQPDQELTKGEMVKMMMLVERPDPMYYKESMEADSNASFADVSNASPYFAYVEAAVRQGYLNSEESQNFNPDAVVDREELALFVSRVLGYDELASADDLFKSPFSDTSDIEHLGAAAIVSHFGIMTGIEGKFEPEAEVTRAQAATAFLRLLSVRANQNE
ncbi:YcdB/YcdC domain-containing protein [Aureibacillus halotolerans]|uniref:S-layer family protein n=1 Tax=Aureibacillus halotolerans TaxID=1508390 RepID=A0A4R6U8W4_9BACI|nr:YcdB/YcdC domain-containing protein [Aureibacillus halotolerans]TDQ42192.1 S-layer family protein [Aureibacillus halotolerans]